MIVKNLSRLIRVRNPTSSTKRALLWSAVFLVLFSSIFLIVVTHWIDTKSDLQRNNLFRRGWVEFINSTAEHQPDETLVIIVSNSQGYGGEVEDDATYASRLEQLFAENDQKKLRVLNWSIYGGHIVEMGILAAAAKRLEPDLFFYIENPSRFHSRLLRYKTGKGRSIGIASDIGFLLWYSEIRDSIPKRFLAPFFRPIDFFEIALAHIFKPYRYRELLLSELTVPEPIKPFDKRGRLGLWHQKPISREKLSRQLRQNEKMAKEGRPVVKPEDIGWDLVSDFFRAADGMTGEKYFIQMPLHSLAHKQNDAITKYFAQIAEESGFKVSDFTQNIPDEEYISLTHLNEAGHQRMAARLAELIKR